MRHVCVVLICGLCACLSLGCASELAGGQKVLKFRAHDDEAFAQAPSSGTYVVAYRQVGAKDLWPADGTRRKVAKGETLGFTRDEAGQVIAVAGPREKS